jgi:hypothetical protein
MKKTAILALAVGAVALLGCIDVAQAQERRAGIANNGSSRAKARYYRKRPLQVTIYRGRRIGGYSYSASDVTSTYGSSPPPYADVRQTPSGPFDSGFFFDSGIGPHGGNSPYLH